MVLHPGGPKRHRPYSCGLVKSGDLRVDTYDEDDGPDPRQETPETANAAPVPKGHGYCHRSEVVAFQPVEPPPPPKFRDFVFAKRWIRGWIREKID